MGSVTARAYTSSANLGHGLDVLGLCVNVFYDEVTARHAPASAGLSIATSGVASDRIPTDPTRNTAGLAVQALCNAHDVRCDLQLEIHKGVRPGSGLGSSAASAAGAVLAVSELLGLSLELADLVPFAAEGEAAAAGTAHADNVAAALLGGFVLLTDNGPVALPSASPPAMAIVFPNIAVSTAEARAALPKQVTMAAHIDGIRGVASTIAAWQAGDAEAFGASIAGGLADSCRRAFITGFEQATEAAHAAGASGVCISGAGPALLAVCPPQMDPLEVGVAMQQAFGQVEISADVYAAEPGPAARVVSKT